MSSLTSSSPSISEIRDQRIEEILLKIKAINSSSTSPRPPNPEVQSAPSGKYIIPSRRTPSPQPVSEKYLIPARRSPSPPPKVPETAPPSPILIIYSSEIHQPWRTPSPKRLLPTFPCPPQIELPPETKISL